MTIRFACICDHRFELPADQAGTQFQCPNCLRLVDVPQLNELSAFEDDGTLRMDDARPAESGLGSKVRAFSHSEDLRSDLDSFLNIGQPPPDPAIARPRYDPITGELVRPLGMQIDARAALLADNAPVAAPVLGYSTHAVIPASLDLKWWHIPLRLLQSRSGMAMLFVFLAHVLVTSFLVIPAANLLLLPAAALLIVSVIAHYGNVIDQIGPQNHDDVPVLLRSVSFSEDVWLPMIGFFIAAFLSFGPAAAVVFFVNGPWLVAHAWVLATVAALGAFVFPAAFLTAASSGALENMWLPRVLRVIAAAPVRYVLALVSFLIACTAYVVFAAGVFSTIGSPMAIAVGGMGVVPRQILINLATQAFAAAVATYFMHLSMVWLAMIYRTHHEQFRWVLQEHQKRPREDTLARLAALRRAGDPRVRRAPGRTPTSPVRATPALAITKAVPVEPVVKDNPGVQIKSFDV